MIENVSFVMAIAFSLTIVAAWRAIPLLAIASLVDLALRRRLAPAYHALLWTLVALRLLLPFSLPIPWSLHGPVDGAVMALLNASSERVDSRPVEDAKPLSKAPATAPSVQYFPPQADFQAQVDAPAAKESRATEVDWSYRAVLTLGCVWSIVAGGLLLRGAVAHARFSRRLNRSRELTDPTLVDLLRKECASLRISRTPRLIETSDLETPAAFGLFRPVLCLPVGATERLSSDELRWVVRHELAHLRRRDAWLAALASIVSALQWHNPLAWLVGSRLRSHMEAAADDVALDGAPPADAIEYGRLLLKFADRSTAGTASPAIGLLAFATRRRLRMRIERLVHARPARSNGVRAAGVATALLLAIAGLTDAGEPWDFSPKTERSAPRFPLSRDLSIAGLDATGPTSRREYDVSEALTRIGDERELLTAARMGFPGVRDVRLEGATLVAEVTDVEHRELTSRLDAWNRAGLRQIVVASRFLQPDLQKIAPIEWRHVRVDRMGDGSIPFIATTITDAQLFQLLSDVQGDTRSNVLQAPKSTHFNGQSIAYSNLVRTPFVTSVELETNGSVLRPVIEVYDEGFRMDVRPTALDGETIELEAELRISRIGEVKEIDLPFKLPRDHGATVTVQAPSVASSAARCIVRLRKGEHLLIATPQVRDDSSPESAPSTTFFALSPYLLDVMQKDGRSKEP